MSVIEISWESSCVEGDKYNFSNFLAKNILVSLVENRGHAIES